MNLLIDRIESEIGELLVVCDGESLCILDFAGCEPRMTASLAARYGGVHLKDADDPLGFGTRIREDLAGDLDALDDIPVATGGTDFQRRVWPALRAIPVGTTISYGGLAKRLGKPGASRAVGMANSLNPVAIVVPCHRVIGADGRLTGYAGGLERKRWLLAHEGVDVAALAGSRAA